MVKVLRLIGPFWKVSLLVKIPCIPPLFENYEYITDFKKNNSFFANQCSLINNNSQLPRTLYYMTNERLYSIKITDDDILKIIAKLDPNKAHGHDKMNHKPLRLIFNNFKQNLKNYRAVSLLPICGKDSYITRCLVSFLIKA